ncbi:GntR family transcriptional regulator [Cohaesibacter celericrescens]|uniref:GntR family transcriptional regulator n=1 Tax=Cohaesibacter celericrescens TaxID=2067669 RepID=A0A2N5XR28_9HYPH|nr:GntR family transcriptional regulator [Cohaesibacter celericrescens]PLW76897.1 GntR family transcriptional regulator [Cohaesibacter celericrescens]
MAGDGSTKHTDASQSVRQLGYELFQNALFEGRLKSGQLVSQRDLVQLMNLSIGALRELLPRLESEGLITVVPQRGIQITAIDLPMIRDAFQMRAALEREAVMTAVRILPANIIGEQRKLHDDFVAAASANPTDEVLKRGQEIDNEFHNLLVQCTGNEILLHAYNINVIRIRLIRKDRINLTENLWPQTFRDHVAIIDALAKRDTAAAVDAMDQHISNARKRATEF